MAIAKITGEGLAWIAVMVTLLWGCVLLEDSMVKHSRRETARVLLDLRKMKNGGRVLPASRPLQFPGFTRPVAG
ncbi:MAG: hypothetical protein JWO80_5566 [Bryobacterales bacterium]|nr:hypothetical protein [Bryobacterales bacterium]